MGPSLEPGKRQTAAIDVPSINLRPESGCDPSCWRRPFELLFIKHGKYLVLSEKENGTKK
jgi:hypothetical protein